ncbi:Na/Pi cotransporter family protein [Colwellia ponticola]|uniref:Na/Pi cotransporter family protein n=1 Tax=Colwellia ponticola TaxID=2304625 RepID=A0A8H2JNV8_9GAMM|nr:Na/Pi symporter [Colwellia ponticola]TMM45732.1 Na/Pi cotransporter family protein [Colwellia ponticola]
MGDIIASLGSLLGGLGLFLLAIKMMTDGLQRSAGSSLRKVLSNSTDTPFKGIVSGFTMTALVQSSSAVTVASIGFVNAGLLTMRQTLGIIYGANIGTTITGWLVAFIGFKLDVQAFALPLIGIGMALQLIKNARRLAAFGIALVGFGLFFLGIDVLKDTFEGLVTTFDITQISVNGVEAIVIFLFVGIAMTVLTQSSSAAIALTITAAASSLIDINTAAAMVIGANVGTTSTALLASIGATANAKRVALAQVLFNLGTAIVALLLMPLMLIIIDALSNHLAMAADPAITLALFHTIFNVLGVMLIFPLNKVMATFLEKRFISRDQASSLPKFLDKTLVATPVLAVNAVVMELDSIEQRVRILVKQLIQLQYPVSNDEAKQVKPLLLLVSQFIGSLERNETSAETTNQLATLLRINQYLFSGIKCAIVFDEKHMQSLILANETVHSEFALFQQDLLQTLAAETNYDRAEAQVFVQRRHDIMKVMILKEAAEGRLNFEVMLVNLDALADLLEMTLLLLKARKYLQQLIIDTHLSNPEINTADSEPIDSDEVNNTPALL